MLDPSRVATGVRDIRVRYMQMRELSGEAYRDTLLVISLYLRAGTKRRLLMYQTRASAKCRVFRCIFYRLQLRASLPRVDNQILIFVDLIK